MPISRSDRVTIGISMGDPLGIGPEITIKSLGEKKSKDVNFIVFGSRKIFEKALEISNSNLSIHYTKVKNNLRKKYPVTFVDIPADLPVDFMSARVNAQAGKASLQYFKTAIEYAQMNKIQGVVTAPINKESLYRAGYSLGGHTEYIAKYTKTKNVVMMLKGGGLRVALVTRHIPIRDVATKLTTKKIIQTIQIAYKGLQTFYGLKTPRVVVTALNPHAGEGGKIGTEEIDIIIPALEQCRKINMNVLGPFSADSVFRNYKKLKADLVIAMYHDQGLTALKAFAKNKGVNITLGVPFPRTSPDHGTAFDIAWKNIADATSLQESIKSCIEMVTNGIN